MTRYPPLAQYLECAQVDFFVASPGGRNAFAVFGECRRVENDHVESAPYFIAFFEHIKCICFAKSDCGDSVAFFVAAAGFARPSAIDQWLRRARCGVGHAQGETTLIREAIEHLAAGIGASGAAIFPLIQKAAGLLPFQQIECEQHSVLAGEDFRASPRKGRRLVGRVLPAGALLDHFFRRFLEAKKVPARISQNSPLRISAAWLRV